MLFINSFFPHWCGEFLIFTLNIVFRIKQGILQALVNEQEKLVKNAIASFIGLIAKHEFPNNKWPEILQFINHLSASDNIVDKEVP